MAQNKKNIKVKIKFIFIVCGAIILTVLFASYVSELLFNGKNSLKVYNALKKQKTSLQFSIKKLQYDNARLQKEYFELKNLEPDE